MRFAEMAEVFTTNVASRTSQTAVARAEVAGSAGEAVEGGEGFRQAGQRVSRPVFGG
jgi:hypothetical protein